MRSLFVFSWLFLSVMVAGQSKSVDRFRKSYAENTSAFIYRSTLNMLNPDRNPDFAELVRDIDEIRVLCYTHDNMLFSEADIARLKNNLREELYHDLFMLSDQGSQICLYGKEKRDRTIGMVAIINSPAEFILVDIVGSLDFSKFIQLKNKLDKAL